MKLLREEQKAMAQYCWLLLKLIAAAMLHGRKTMILPSLPLSAVQQLLRELSKLLHGFPHSKPRFG
jgi:hypothetical protein